MISNRKAESATIGLLEHPERHSSLSKPEVLEILRLEAGMTVAEIGAARGDLCLPISHAVGSAGHVFAVEAIPEMFHGLRQRSENQRNIHLVAEPYHETALAGESCARVVMANLWVGLHDPLATLGEVARLLRKDGRLVLIEWRPDAPYPPGPPPDQRIEFRAMVQLLERHGWDLHRHGDASPFSYFLEAAICDESVQS
jgi:ubiquinone/menaquinone biosynthesis C-methylase UbiE